jgi:hypothetical protein
MVKKTFECEHFEDNNLINRQKAEIEDLKKVVIDDYASEYDNKIKAEAVKEFAERLEENLGELFMANHSWVGEIVDNLLKETVGEKDG